MKKKKIGVRNIKNKVKEGKTPPPAKPVSEQKQQAAEAVVQAPKLDVWFMDVSSLSKNPTDPKGTMLVVKDKHEEIGIHVDPTNSHLLFSYYPKAGGEMKNVPITLKQIVKFITQ
jgi:hypothetical protein